VVVAFSVLVQGGLAPAMARWCDAAMRQVTPRPWSLGMRLRDQPEGVCCYMVAEGSAADGRTVGELHLGDNIWISLIVREGRSVRVRSDTQLRAGDEVLILVDPDHDAATSVLFTRRESVR
jgi:cell volume regulation protein A